MQLNQSANTKKMVRVDEQQIPKYKSSYKKQEALNYPIVNQKLNYSPLKNQKEAINKIKNVQSPILKKDSNNYIKEYDFAATTRNRVSSPFNAKSNNKSMITETYDMDRDEDIICNNCINLDLMKQKNRRTQLEKEGIKEYERNLTLQNKMHLDKINNILGLKKQLMNQEALKTRDNLNKKFEDVRERRRTPPRELMNPRINEIYDEQAIREHNSKRGNFEVKKYQKDQIAQKNLIQQIDNNNNNTSLDIGRSSSNKYVDDAETIKQHLLIQINEKKYSAERQIRV